MSIFFFINGVIATDLLAFSEVDEKHSNLVFSLRLIHPRNAYNTTDYMKNHRGVQNQVCTCGGNMHRAVGKTSAKPLVSQTACKGPSSRSWPADAERSECSSWWDGV